MYARSTYEGRNLPPSSRLGVIPSQKSSAPITWKSAPYLPTNPFVSPLEVYNTLTAHANPNFKPTYGKIYHPVFVSPPVKPPKKWINPFRIHPIEYHPIEYHPINCSTMKTCPDGSKISICQSCPEYKKCPDGQTVPINQSCPTQYKTCPDGQTVPINQSCPTGGSLTGGNALGGFIGSALMLIPFL